MRYLLSTCVLCLTALPSAAQDHVNTMPSWNGTSFISSFGVPNTATYGQVITVPAASTPITGFEFQINCTSGSGVTFRGLIYAWDGSKATGIALFTSGPQTLSTTPLGVFNLVSFSVPNLTVPAGQYVLLATTSLDYTGAPSGACRWGSVTNNATYPGGQFVFQNNSGNTAQWTSTTWSTIAQDLAFRVTGLVPFSTIPAASTTSLLATILFLALGGSLMMMRRPRTS